jgi:hypothetical protein
MTHTILTGTQNGYTFRIVREGGNQYFTFLSNGAITAEYYTYGVAKTLAKLYSFIN